MFDYFRRSISSTRSGWNLRQTKSRGAKGNEIAIRTLGILWSHRDAYLLDRFRIVRAILQTWIGADPDYFFHFFVNALVIEGS